MGEDLGILAGACKVLYGNLLILNSHGSGPTHNVLLDFSNLDLSEINLELPMSD